MSIAKPFTFTANTYAKASEVNADFDTLYSQVNTNISDIAANATDIDNLESNKADINGSSSQRFAVADPVTNGDAVNKQTMIKSIGNSINLISGLIITKDSGSPEDTILVSEGSCYDSTKAVVLGLDDAVTKQNLNQGASTTYYVYIIGNSTGSSTDILISSNSTTPTLPSGYSLYRLIGSYTTDADSKIKDIYSYSNSVQLSNISGLSMIPDYSARISRTSGTDYTADSNGYLLGIGVSNGSGHEVIIYINSTMQSIMHDARGGGYNAFSACVPIAKGDTYSFGSVVNTNCYFVPVKGGI